MKTTSKIKRRELCAATLKALMRASRIDPTPPVSERLTRPHSTLFAARRVDISQSLEVLKYISKVRGQGFHFLARSTVQTDRHKTFTETDRLTDNAFVLWLLFGVIFLWYIVSSAWRCLNSSTKLIVDLPNFYLLRRVINLCFTDDCSLRSSCIAAWSVVFLNKTLTSVLDYCIEWMLDARVVSRNKISKDKMTGLYLVPALRGVTVTLAFPFTITS